MVLVEGPSRRDEKKWMGKTDTFKKAFFDKSQLPIWKSLNQSDNGEMKEIQKGDYVVVKVNEAYSKSLICEPLAIMSLQSYYTQN